MDFADQEAALVELAVGLMGDAHQRVSSTPEPFHGVGGGVCSDVSQLRHGLPQLLFITEEDGGEKISETVFNEISSSSPRLWSSFFFVCLFWFFVSVTFQLNIHTIIRSKDLMR